TGPPLRRNWYGLQPSFTRLSASAEIVASLFLSLSLSGSASAFAGNRTSDRCSNFETWGNRSNLSPISVTQSCPPARTQCTSASNAADFVFDKVSNSLNESATTSMHVYSTQRSGNSLSWSENTARSKELGETSCLWFALVPGTSIVKFAWVTP